MPEKICFLFWYEMPDFVSSITTVYSIVAMLCVYSYGELLDQDRKFQQE